MEEQRIDPTTRLKGIRGKVSVGLGNTEGLNRFIDKIEIRMSDFGH